MMHGIKSVSILIPTKASLDTIVPLNLFLGSLTWEDSEIILVVNGIENENFTKIERYLLENYQGRIPLRVFLSEKGLGSALKFGVLCSTKKWVWFTADDVPFQTSDIENAWPHRFNCALILGSKFHPHSTVQRGPLREFISSIFNSVRRFLLKDNLSDTQGTFFLNRKLLSPIVGACEENSYLFTTELASLTLRRGLKVLEVPVSYVPLIFRPSTIKLISIFDIFLGLLRLASKQAQDHSFQKRID